MELALDGISAYKNWAEYTGLRDPQAAFTHTGALWMLGKTREENVEMAKRLEQFGVGSEIMDAKVRGGRERGPPVVLRSSAPAHYRS